MTSANQKLHNDNSNVNNVKPYGGSREGKYISKHCLSLSNYNNMMIIQSKSIRETGRVVVEFVCLPSVFADTNSKPV